MVSPNSRKVFFLVVLGLLQLYEAYKTTTVFIHSEYVVVICEAYNDMYAEQEAHRVCA